MRQPRGCVVRALTAYGLFLLGLCLAWILGGHALAWWRLRAEERAWTATGTGMDAIRYRFPKAAPSRAAQDLDRSTRGLGIRLLGYPDQPSGVDPALKELLFKYSGQLRGSKEPSLPAVPVELRSFLDEHRAEIHAVARQLEATSGISWVMDIETPDQSLPNLLSQRCLHLLLLSEAVELLRRGDQARAHELLTAAWRQQQTLAPRPELISQLIAIGLADEERAVVRLWPEAPPEWQARLGQGAHRDGYLRSLQVDAYGWLFVGRGHRGIRDLETKEASPSPAGLLIRVATAPYVRLAAAGNSHQLRLLGSRAAADKGCASDGDALAAEILRTAPRWNVLVTTMMPSLARAWPSAVAADLDAELTRLVLDVRKHPAAAATSYVVPSQVCTGSEWSHRCAADGSCAIELESVPELVRGLQGREALGEPFLVAPRRPR